MLVVLVAAADEGERPVQGGHHGAGDQQVRVRRDVGWWVCAERGSRKRALERNPNASVPHSAVRPAQRGEAQTDHVPLGIVTAPYPSIISGPGGTSRTRGEMTTVAHE